MKDAGSVVEKEGEQQTNSRKFVPTEIFQEANRRILLAMFLIGMSTRDCLTHFDRKKFFKEIGRLASRSGNIRFNDDLS